MKGFLCAGALALVLCAPALTASASSLVYHPVNPNFGGNPLIGTFLLQEAQAQGKGAQASQQQQQFPDITFPDLGNVGNTQPIIIIGGNGTPTIPTNP
jgi:curli production assembly/transport component CsgF